MSASSDDWADEVGTSPNRIPVSASLPPEDLHVAMGKLMASVARLMHKVNELQTLPAEVAQLRRDVELDRGALVKGASRSAARHSSNRLALLMSALFTIYEVSSPYLRDLWRLAHK